MIAVLAFVLSETTFVSVDRLMRPPKIEGQSSEIQAAFEASVNDKYILRSPLSGEYKSSYISVNLDKDKDEEAIVFYSLSVAPDVARMNIIDSVDGNRKSIADLDSAHKQIHKVDFADLDKDGKKEIIVGWSIFETELSNTLSIYRLKEDKDALSTEKIFESNYTEYIVCDVNSDNKTDLVLFDSVYGSNNGVKAVYYDFKSETVRTAGEFMIDPVITSVYSVCFDKDKTNGNTRFYVDGYRPDNSMTTELFYWHKAEKRFERPHYGDSAFLTSVATRSTAITCKDINDDGVVEIPFEEHIKESRLITANSANRQQSIIKWMKYGNNTYKCLYYELINLAGNYSLKIKNSWYGVFTVINDTEKGVLTFYSAGGQYSDAFADNGREDGSFAFSINERERPHESSDALFCIISVPDSDTSFYDLSGSKYLKNDNGFNYFCRIYEAGKKSGITKDSIKKILIT